MFDELVFGTDIAEESEFMPISSVDEEEDLQSGGEIPELLPLLALKNTVLFPGIVIPITVGREKYMEAVRKAHDTKKLRAVVAQKDDDTEDPEAKDLFTVGTIARILKVLKMPDGSITAIIQ